MDTTTPTSVVLNKAADLIEVCGWERGGSRNSSNPEVAAKHPGYCLEGAISQVAGQERYASLFVRNIPAHAAMTAYLGGEIPWIWNDNLVTDEATGGWVGGSQEAAHAYASSRAVEALRAAALIEQAKESSAVQVPAEVVAGDIGDDQREYEFEPLTAPEPLTIPAPAEPVRTPEEVPA